MNEWISVDDRLPEEYDEVLVYDQEECMYVARRGIASFHISCDCYEGSSCFPTHWMPLPKKPKE